MKPLASKTVWQTILSKPKSWIILLVVAAGFFTLNVGIKNYRTLENLAADYGLGVSIKFLAILVQGFHHTVTLSSYITLVIISFLTGIVVTLLAFKTQALRSGKVGLSSSAGIALGVIAPGCAACGVGLAALFGITGSTLAALPLKGLEISLLSIALLGLAIHNLTQGLRACDLCKVTFNKTAERRSIHNGRKN